MSYSLQNFGKMILDTVRMDAFTAALRRSIQPGSVVADIGAGTGIFALLACQYGAKHVYAIEPNPLIELGKRMAAANGVADCITFIPQMSTSITLPERADVIVADIRGRLPLYEGIIGTFADARKRLLKPGGVIIPHHDTLFATLVEAPELYRKEVFEPWGANRYDLNMKAALPTIVNSPVSHTKPTPESILLAPQEWVTLDYSSRENPNVAGRMEWEATRPGTAHFVAVWFDTQLVEGIGYSGAPEAETPKVYGYELFPLSSPVALVQGDKVALEMFADLVGDRYITRWNTRVMAAGDGSVKADLKQSSFFSIPLAGMRQRTKSFVPKIGNAGRATAAILDLMGEGLTLEVIAQRVAAQFPTYFTTFDLALARVADLSQSFSE